TFGWEQRIQPPTSSTPFPPSSLARPAGLRASGTASAGRKKPEPRVNSQIEWSWRSIEEATPPLPVHWTFAGSEFAGLRTHLEKKSGKLGKLPSASTEKSQGNCRNLARNKKRTEKLQIFS
uniref:Uncharacterized protein n=1 Tax=Spermophilus dauricus TaxID=99837 RepID=A0A8C9PN98_SPEDA